MMQLGYSQSILAIDPTSRGLAFVFFDRGILRDWGTRRRDGDELALLDELLERLGAEALILEDGDAPRCERRPRMRKLLRTLAGQARRREIVVVTIPRYEVRQWWAARGATRKHAVAVEIGTMFEELEPLVPRRRKSFRSEQARTDIFDAASLVLHACGAATRNHGAS